LINFRKKKTCKVDTKLWSSLWGWRYSSTVS